MDFFNDMDTTHLIILGVAVLTLLVALGMLFYNRSGSKGSEKSSPSAEQQTQMADLQRQQQQVQFAQQAQQAQQQQPQFGGVLVMFFAPWCGHCKTLEPLWDELIQNFDGSNGIKIIKVNGQENPHFMELHRVNGFPTIKYCPHGLEDPNGMVYNGDRSMNSLIDFLQQCRQRGQQ